MPLAGVGSSAHYLYRPVQVRMVRQQLGQLPGGSPVAVVGPGAQLVQVAALGQQLGQPPGGSLVAVVGPAAQLVQVAALPEQAGELRLSAWPSPRTDPAGQASAD